jgi:site-specific recombinase XerD
MYLFKRHGYFHIEYFDESENRTRRISTRKKRKDEALKFLSEFKERLSDSHRPQFISLHSFAESYSVYVKNRYSTNYFLIVKLSLKALTDFTGEVALKDVEIRLLEKFFDTVSARSKHTASLYHRTLATAFNKAIEWNYLSENPLKKIKLPKIPRNFPLFMSETEFHQILEHTAKPDMKDTFTLAFHTGLRLSELLNLEWKAVNLAEGIIKVSNTETFTTKSKKERIVPLNQTALDMLRKRQPKVFSLEQRNYVFHKHPGLRYERNFVSKQFKKAVRAAGLNEGLHFHSLRHSTASNMVRRGVPIAVVKEVLGHSDISTTMIYSHVRREDLANAVRMLDGAEDSSNAV